MRESSHASWPVPLCAAVLFMSVALCASRDYGLAFDSHLWFPFGDRILKYLLGEGPWPVGSFLRGLQAYGVLAAVGAATTNALLHDILGLTDALLGHHAFVIVCGAAVVGLTARLAADLFGLSVSWWAAALLALHPRFFAQAQTNVSDIPAAVASTAMLCYVVRGIRTERLAPLVAAAVAFGAVGGIRFAHLPFLPCIPVLWLALDGEARAHARALWHRSRWWNLPALAGVVVASLWAFRPLAWTAPADELRTVLDHFWFTPRPLQGVAPVFYLGQVHFLAPWSYHPVLLLVTTPLPVLLLGALGVVCAWRRDRTHTSFLLAWIAVSLARHTLLVRGNYDGVRHMMDAFPALAILAGVGAAATVEILATRLRGTRVRGVTLITTLLAVAILAPGARAIWHLHPYAAAYYNVLVGGPQGAARLFEPEYTGVAYREGIEWASAHLSGEDVLWVRRGFGDSLIVQLEAHYLGLSTPRIVGFREVPTELVSRKQPGKLYLMHILRPGPTERPPPGMPLSSLPVVYEIARDGVALLRVRHVPRSLLVHLHGTP